MVRAASAFALFALLVACRPPPAAGYAVPIVPVPEPSLAALVIRAHVAEGLGELRYQLKPKRTNP